MVSYTTLLVPVEFPGSDEDLIAETLAQASMIDDLEIAKIEIVNSNEDGRRLRYSTACDETAAMAGLVQLARRVDFISSLHVRFSLTAHSHEFDDAKLWPREAIEQRLIADGYQRLELYFNTPSWLPVSLINSILTDALLALFTAAGLDYGRNLESRVIDGTEPTMPSFLLWLTPAAYSVLADGALSGLVEEWIDKVCDHPLLVHWFQRLEDDETED